MDQLPILIIVFPLFTAFALTLLGWFRPAVCQPLTVVGLLGSSLSAIATLAQVVNSGPISYHLGGWAPPFGIEYRVDALNAMVLMMVSSVALLVAVYARKPVQKELGGKISNFYTLFILLVTGLLGITITGDAFNLYVLLEIAALTSYALIALGRGRAYMATFNYVILGTVGACFYLLGVGFLLIKTGTLNMVDIGSIVPSLSGSRAILVAFAFLMMGCWLKMALFPFHGWLPNAYTNAPTAVSCLVAPLMTKVSVYVMLRIMFTMYSVDWVFSVITWKPLVMALAVIAILMGSCFALAQRNIKRMLTYLIVAEIGYMVGGAWLGNASGYIGASYHILADGLMTVCLFMVVGSIVYKRGRAHIEDFKGAFSTMPWTMGAFILGALSMIGVPPTCGFFSKWYLLSGAYQSGDYAFGVALLLSSLINAVLFIRIVETAFFSATSDEEPDPHSHQETCYADSPPSMLLPLWASALALLAMGLYSSEIVTRWIQPVIPGGLL
jgi:multicomponent Na+:H+ antiporter subunit D